MDIAIIGAGNVGRALAASSVRAGHSVVISSNDPEDAATVAAEVGARAAATNVAAFEGARIVILAIPASALQGAVAGLGDALAGEVVIDVTNRPTPDLSNGSGAATSVAEELQAALPNAHVVKAFNTAFASRQADPVVDGVQLDGFVAADDPEAKAAVLELVRSIGFRPVDAGPLAFARTLEGMAWLNISLNMRPDGSWQNGWKLAGPMGSTV